MSPMEYVGAISFGFLLHALTVFCFAAAVRIVCGVYDIAWMFKSYRMERMQLKVQKSRLATSLPIAIVVQRNG